MFLDFSFLNESLNGLRDTLYDIVYPVGSTYITETNTPPSSILGGVWSLYDKEYKSQKISATTTLTDNVSNATVYVHLSGHDILLTFSYTPSVTITDSTIELFTINPNSCGAKQFGDMSWYPITFTDGGQSVVCHQLTSAGKVSSTDIIVRGSTSTSLAVGHTISQINFLIKQRYLDYMLDSFCNKFYWKRTS